MSRSQLVWLQDPVWNYDDEPREVRCLLAVLSEYGTNETACGGFVISDARLDRLDAVTCPNCLSWLHELGTRAPAPAHGDEADATIRFSLLELE